MDRHLRGVNQPRPNVIFIVRGDEFLRGLLPWSQGVQTRVQGSPAIDGRGGNQFNSDGNDIRWFGDDGKES